MFIAEKPVKWVGVNTILFTLLEGLGFRVWEKSKVFTVEGHECWLQEDLPFHSAPSTGALGATIPVSVLRQDQVGLPTPSRAQCSSAAHHGRV